MRVRIATYNLESLDDREDRGPPLAARVAALGPALAALDADVVCLQEVNSQPDGHHHRRLAALEAVLAQTPYAGFRRADTCTLVGRHERDVHNLVTISRFPIAAHELVRHEHVPAPTFRSVTARPEGSAAVAVEWDRPLLHARLDVGGAPLHVINVHLRAPRSSLIEGQKQGRAWLSTAGWAEGYFLAAMKRDGQALEARLLVDRLLDADERARIAVAGDFNAGTHDVPLVMLRADPADTGNAALAARMLTPAETRVPESQRYTEVHAGRRLLPDHILVSAALAERLKGAEIRNVGLADETSDDQPAGSFHAPLVAEFEL